MNSQAQLITLGGHDGPIEMVGFDPAGTQVITASSDGTAKIWDPRPVEQRGFLAGSLALVTVAFDPANPSVLVTVGGNASNVTMTLWDLRHPGRPMASINEPSQSGTAASGEFSDDGRLLVTTGGSEQAWLYRVADLVHFGAHAKPLTKFDATRHGSPCGVSKGTLISGFNSAIVSHDDSLVATADNNGNACIWNASTGQPVKLIQEPPGGSGGLSGSNEGSAPLRWVQFSRDGNRLLTASNDGTARIWDVRTGRPTQVLTEPSREAINDAWFNRNDSLVVTASDAGTVGIWDANTGIELHRLVVPDHSEVFNATFSPDGRWVVTCGGSGHIFTIHGELLTNFQYGNTLSDCEFSPNGKFIAAAGDGGTTRVFSTELAGKLKQIESMAGGRVTRQLSPAERKQYGVS